MYWRKISHRSTRSRLVGASSVAILAALAATPAAYAQEATAKFDVPEQPLSQALLVLGGQAHISVAAPRELVAGRVGRPVQGELTAHAALDRLLDGSGLKVEFVAVNAARIVAPDPQASSAGGGAETNVVQELVVTAQKKSENIQVVPIAISAFTQQDLTTRQVAGGPDLMTQVPNMTFTKTNFSSYSIQIRGIGTQAISATTDPAVAVAFNNTPFIRNRFFEQEFYDLERLEVLRGPQGTLYGRNATAGVVNIISAKPKFEFQAKLSADVANYASKRVEGMVNLPLIEDKAALRIAGAWTKRDGFVKNLLTGDQTDGRDLWSTRVTLGLEPTEKLSVNLIWEHFQENDDRLRSGKQLCHSDPGPSEINGIPVGQSAASIGGTPTVGYVSQGCLPASLYSPDSYDTPNGYALPYYGPLGSVGLPVYINMNPYVSTFQSHDLRAIETHLTPDYEASADLLELQWQLQLPWNLTLASETAYDRDKIFSFEDYNRFDTSPGVFDPGGRDDDRFDIVHQDGVFCDPQLGCTDRLAGGDLSQARSRQFSQEFRLSSDFDGPFNFNLGANFLRYDTVENYYVFINTLTMWEAMLGKDELGQQWQPGVSDNGQCFAHNFYGPADSDPNQYYSAFGCAYIDPNDIHHLNGQGRNYFLSKNPYHLLSYAAFGEAYWQITPDLKLTAGLRWTDDKKTAPQIPSWLLAGGNNQYVPSQGTYGLPARKIIQQEWKEPTGRVALDWRPHLSFTDETLVYGSYVRGYKAGGANPPPAMIVFATVCPPECGNQANDIVQVSLTHPETFKPEFVNAFEVGTKNTLLDGRLTANLAAFYYDYTGYQISEIVDRSAVNMNFDAKIWGLELEADWRPLENLRLGFKGGYEHTRVADGSKAIDLMDRTAGKPGWMVWRPFPTLTSNCVIPINNVAIDWPGNTGVPGEVGTVPLPTAVCSAYILGLDPVTYLPYVPNPTESVYNPIPEGYPGYDPRNANNGQGFEKDLSGHKLPNAPSFTATITADYTLPLPADWLATLHADLYYQSEAWTRIFNDPGYDKLKAYKNINLAAIFTNEAAGLTVMAYVKNVLDKDNITGAFLNSDDTGLTTNVFLNEPRLYGIRVTKNWTGGPGWISSAHRSDGPYPFTLEFGAQMQREHTPAEAVMPHGDAFSGALNPGAQQVKTPDWSDRPEIRLSYRPSGSPWEASVGVRYGRVGNHTGRLRQDQAAGDPVCFFPTEHFYLPQSPGTDLGFVGKLFCDPHYGPVHKVFDFNGYHQDRTFNNKYNSNYLATPKNRLSTLTDHTEEHLVVDFKAGRDVGIGFLGASRSALSAGLRYAEFKSTLSGDMRGVPDMNMPDQGWQKYDTTFHQYAATFDAKRKFSGAGPMVAWEASRPIWGKADEAHLGLDWALAGGALFGKQKSSIKATEGSSYFDGGYPSKDYVLNGLQPPTQTPVNIPSRSKTATVPVLDLSLGLSWQVPGVKISGGYRWERYFNVLDGGYLERKSYDRTIDGPYLRFSLGFGG